MRRISFIGSALLAAAIVASVAGSTAAEARARGFRLRLGVGSAAAGTPAPTAPRPAERVAAVAVSYPIAHAVLAGAASATLRPEPAAETSEPAAERKPPAAPPTAPAAAPVRVAGPWCPPERIVGAGAGFCEVN